MAQDPIYKRTNIYDIETPKLNLDVYQQAIGSSRQIEQALDRLTGTALKKTGEQAAERGKRYGIDNPISIDQLLKGTESGETNSDLFVQDTTIFGKNARKYQAKIARVDLEYLARKEFQEIQLQVDAGIISTKEQLENAVNGVIVGYGKPLQGIDPEEELSFNASISQAGRQVVGNSLSTLVKNFDASNIAEADDYVKNIYVDELTTQLNSMEVKDPAAFEAFISSDELAVKNKINSIINKQERAKLEKEMLSKKREVVQNAIAKHFMNNLDPEVGYADAIRQINNGEAGEWTAFLNDNEFVGEAGKQGIIKQIKTQYDQMETALKSAQEKEKRDVLEQQTDLEYIYLYSLDPNERERAEKGLLDLSKNPHYKYTSFLEIQDKKTKLFDAEIQQSSGYLKVMLAISNGEITTTEALQTAGKAMGLTVSQTNRIFGKALTSNEYRKTQEIIKNITNVGTNKGEDPGDKATRAYLIDKKLNEQLLENIEYNKKNPDKEQKTTSPKVLRDQLINADIVKRALEDQKKKLNAFRMNFSVFPEIDSLLKGYEDEDILNNAYDNSPLMIRIEELLNKDSKRGYAKPVAEAAFKKLKDAIDAYKQSIINAEID